MTSNSTVSRFVGLAFVAAITLYSAVDTETKAHEPTAPTIEKDATTASPTVFPLRYARNRRYLVDANDRPFMLKGRTAWYIASLQLGDVVHFLDDTCAKRFNAIEVKGITHDPYANRPPFSGNGEVPFSNRLDGTEWDGKLIGNAADMTTPKEGYWSHLDEILSACEKRGIVVLLFPAYVGYDGGNQGWMQEMVANGPERVEEYGRWIATRYKNRSNLIWMLGGDYSDFNAREARVERALIRGLKSVESQQSQLYSAEWTSNDIASVHPLFGKDTNVNGVYSWENSISKLSRDAYVVTPTMPAFLLEEPYDEEGPDGNNHNTNATQPVRRFVYWGWLNTTGGYIAGNGYIWPFKDNWKRHLNSKGSQDLARINQLVGSIEWWRLVPSGLDGMRDLIISGAGELDCLNYVSSAASREGDLLVAYASPEHEQTFVVDTSGMKSPLRTRWWDPTSGMLSKAEVHEHKDGASFRPPGRNSEGQSDWVLLIDTVSDEGR